MKLYIIRHGQTDWNIAKKIQGRQDIPLNERGRYQAECLSKAMKNRPVTAVFSSPQIRAMETAEAVAASSGAPVIPVKNLMEINYGSWEGKTEEELLANFHQKWRYNIRLAERKGVTVRICGKEMVPAFSDLMLTTGVRDGFVTRKPEYFAAMLDNLGEHARLYMAFDPNDTPIAGTLAIHYGDKVWYLYGASSNEHRNLMPNYLLQWRMIQWAVETNCRIYDFRGVSGDVSEDNPLYGLFRFKQGFGGDFTEFVGEMDLVLSPVIYWAVEHGTSVFKELRKQVYLIRNRGK